MKIVRPLDLKCEDGNLVMDSVDEKLEDLKSAVFYINEKTKDKSDEDFLSLLQQIRKQGYFPNDENIQIEKDVTEQDKFPFLGLIDLIRFKILYTDAIDLLIEQNNLL